MGLFKKPKVTQAAPAPNPAINPIIARDTPNSVDGPYGFASLISTSSSGLRRKANTQKTSLIGG